MRDKLEELDRRLCAVENELNKIYLEAEVNGKEKNANYKAVTSVPAKEVLEQLLEYFGLDIEVPSEKIKITKREDKDGR